MEKLNEIVNRTSDLVRRLNQLAEDLKSQNEQLVRIIKEQIAKEVVARALNQSIYYVYDTGEVFQVIPKLLSDVNGYELVFIADLMNMSRLELSDIYCSNSRKIGLVSKLAKEVLSSEDNTLRESGIIIKDLPSKSGYVRFYGVLLYAGDELRALLGIFSSNPTFPSDGDRKFIGDISQDLSVGLRQQILLKKLEDSNTKLKESLKGSIGLVVKIIGLKDPIGEVHGKNVAALAKKIAEKMQLSEERAEFLDYASMIHDLGKISLPGEILSKPGPLTDVEFGLVKLHPQIGYEFLKDLSFPQPIAEIVLMHHERWDGSGYPKGLKDYEIMLEARILALAEVVESMSHFRIWRDAIPLAEVLHYVVENSGKLFDPEVVRVCINVFEEGFSFPN